MGEAQRVGLVLAVFAVGLLPFSVYQMQSRAFYALQDTRTPALVQVGVVAVLVAVDLTLAAVLPDDVRVYGLAAGHAAAYTIGVCLSVLLLRRRVGRAGAGVASTVLRVAGAAAVGGLAALGTRALLPRGGTVDALVGLAVAGAVGAVVVVLAGLLPAGARGAAGGAGTASPRALTPPRGRGAAPRSPAAVTPTCRSCHSSRTRLGWTRPSDEPYRPPDHAPVTTETWSLPLGSATGPEGAGAPF